MVCSFKPGGIDKAGLIYAYSWRFSDFPTFRQESDCIVNSLRGDGSYDYMGIVFPEKYGYGTKISVCCSFEEYAAPMILISMDNEEDENGRLRTLEYYELVIWKNGLNVWRHSTDKRAASFYKLLGADFRLESGIRHILSAEIREKNILIDIDGKKFDIWAADLTDCLSLGYAACEGICRLYEMSVDKC